MDVINAYMFITNLKYLLGLTDKLSILETIAELLKMLTSKWTELFEIILYTLSVIFNM